MASYTELATIAGNAELMTRVKVACVIAAEAVRSEASNVPNAKERKDWARRTLADPAAAAQAMTWLALARHNTLTAAQITGATDAVLQTAVNESINLLATTGA